MKELNRLLESSDSEVERLLLRAGRDHAPRGAKRRALAAATGALAATTLTAGSTAGAAIAGKATGAAIAGKATAGATAALTVKWIVIVGVASVGMVAGTVAVRTARSTEHAASTGAGTTLPAPSRPRAPGAAAPVPPPPVATVATPTASEEVAPAPAPPPAALVPAVRAAPPALRAIAPPTKPAGSAGSSPAAELAMLDEARGAIGHGDPQRGLSILGAYGTRFPHGAMGPEASVLRIEALVRAGDRPGAKREGDAFLRANPTSPYASRVESLLGASNP